MSLLVFGRTGQVATELQRIAEVTALGREQADLADPVACVAAIASHRPSAVINAAAWTAVDAAETDEPRAAAINAAAPGAMARACADLRIPFLHVSTDYVFDGSGQDAWNEDDPAAPLNAYGRTKLAGERQVLDAGGQALVLRTAWVFSSHGRNFVRSMLRLSESREALSIVSDQVGCPTPAADIAATLVTLAGALCDGQAGGLFHYAGAPPVSWAGFAREILARAGRDVTVRDIPTAEYPTPARRPLNGRLDCSRLTGTFGLPAADWQAGLARVLHELETR